MHVKLCEFLLSNIWTLLTWSLTRTSSRKTISDRDFQLLPLCAVISIQLAPAFWLISFFRSILHSSNSDEELNSLFMTYKNWIELKKDRKMIKTYIISFWTLRRSKISFHNSSIKKRVSGKGFYSPHKKEPLEHFLQWAEMESALGWATSISLCCSISSSLAEQSPTPLCHPFLSH